MRLFAFILISACGGARIPDGDTADDDTGETDQPCEATVIAIRPADQAGNISVTTQVTATFSAPVTGDAWSVGIDGVTGNATLSEGGAQAVFTTSAPLDTETTYVARASACSSVLSATFETAPPPIDPASIEGRTYALRFASPNVTIVHPAGATALMSRLDIEWILVHVLDIDAVADTITASGATGSGAADAIAQDCQAPFSLGTNDFSGNPVIAIGPTTLTFPFDETVISIDNAFVGGVFAEDGAALIGIEISGNLDTRQVDPYLPVDACTALSFFPNADQCAACASDGAIECLEFEIRGQRADWEEALAYDPDLEPGIDCTP